MGAKLLRKGTYSISEIESIMKATVLENINESKKPHDGQAPLKSVVGTETIFTLSDRYKLFFTKGYKCVNCDIEGTYFALEGNHINPNKKALIQQYHLNLYATSKDGQEILITKDHIVPKAKGGKNHISNYQVMCECCNSKKGSKLVIN